MIKKYIIAILCMLILNGQSLQIDQKTKKKLIESGISVEQAKKIIDKQGLTGEKIDSELQDNDLNTDKETIGQTREGIKEELDKALEMDKNISIEGSLEKEENGDELSEKDEDEFVEDTKELEDNKDAEDEVLANKKKDTAYYYGYNAFSGDPEIFQKSIQESIDQDYLIGPGDEIIIMLWGETEFNKSYSVTRDGYLFIKNVGQVFVNGLTLSKL